MPVRERMKPPEWRMGMKAYPKAIARAAALVLLALFFCGATADQARTWSALQDAVDRAGDDEVIALSGDLTALVADAEITVPTGKRLTLDLNGHRLDASADPGQTGRKRCAINIRAGAMFDGAYTNTFDGDAFDSDYIHIEGIVDGDLNVTIKEGQPIWAEWTGADSARDIAGNDYVNVNDGWVRVDEIPARDLPEGTVAA